MSHKRKKKGGGGEVVRGHGGRGGPINSLPLTRGRVVAKLQEQAEGAQSVVESPRVVEWEALVLFVAVRAMAEVVILEAMASSSVALDDEEQDLMRSWEESAVALVRDATLSGSSADEEELHEKEQSSVGGELRIRVVEFGDGEGLLPASNPDLVEDDLVILGVAQGDPSEAVQLVEEGTWWVAKGVELVVGDSPALVVHHGEEGSGGVHAPRLNDRGQVVGRGGVGDTHAPRPVDRRQAVGGGGEGGGGTRRGEREGWRGGRRGRGGGSRTLNLRSERMFPALGYSTLILDSPVEVVLGEAVTPSTSDSVLESGLQETLEVLSKEGILLCSSKGKVKKMEKIKSGMVSYARVASTIVMSVVVEA